MMRFEGIPIILTASLWLVISNLASIAWIGSTQAAEPIMPEIYLKGELPTLPSEFLAEELAVPLFVETDTCKVQSTQALSARLTSANTLIKMQPHIFPLVSEDFLPSPILPDL